MRENECDGIIGHFSDKSNVDIELDGLYAATGAVTSSVPTAARQRADGNDGLNRFRGD